MKIAIVCPNDLSKPGGIQNLSVAMHNKLIERGHSSVLVSFHPKAKVAIPHTKFFGEGKYIFINQTSTEISTLDLGELEGLNSYFQKEHFDYVCIHHPYAPFMGLSITNIKTDGIKIGWFHATITHDYYRLIATPAASALSYWFKEKLDGFIAVSKSAYKTWSETLTNKGIILPVGVHLHDYKNAKKIDLGKDLNILFVGRLDQRKGVLDAIQALALVRQKQEARLWVIGIGPDRQKAEEMATQLGIKEYVNFLGRVSDEELPTYYKSADVYISPSHGGESLGIVLLEAMAAGTPVIAYSNEGYRCVLGHSPWRHSLVPVENIHILAKAILEIYQDKAIRHEVLTWQNHKIQEYDWNYLIDLFVAYLGTLQKAQNVITSNIPMPQPDLAALRYVEEE